MGKHVDEIMPCERWGAVTADQVYCKKLWFVGQCDAYGDIATKVKTSIRSAGVDGIN